MKKKYGENPALKKENMKKNKYDKKKCKKRFFNNYFDVCSKVWQTNMDIQLVFNEYKAVTYMCQYFPKTEGRCSQAMTKEAKKGFENNMHHHGTIETIAKAYLSNPECSVQEVG